MRSAYPAENKDQTFIVRTLSRMNISTSSDQRSRLLAPAAMLLSVAAGDVADRVLECGQHDAGARRGAA